MKSSDLDRSTVEAAYTRWAPIYDAVCGPVMVNGRRAAQAWAQANKEANLVERRKVAPLGIYTLVCFERAAPLAA